MRKGQVISEEQKAKLRASKRANLIAKYEWSRAEPYWDVEIDNGARNRKAQFITLRQFKSNLDAGEDAASMKARGISKQLLQFFSNWLQGKIRITQEQFTYDYRNGWSLDQISEKYGITREDITFLRQMFDCKATGASYQERLRTELPMTPRQKEIMYGSMMGDAKRMSPTSVGFGQGGKQKKYLFWKYQTFKSVAASEPKRYSSIDKRSGQENISWRFYTSANSDAEKCVQLFYQQGHKEISKEILNALSPLSIAVWFMDDGKTDFYYRLRRKNPTHNITPTPIFCTESFSYESCLLIQQWFLDCWNIRIRLQKKQLKQGVGYRIIVRCEDVQKFYDLIRPHILPMFQYKIDYDAYVKRRKRCKVMEHKGNGVVPAVENLCTEEASLA
jgi:hypothetical protein